MIRPGRCPCGGWRAAGAAGYSYESPRPPRSMIHAGWSRTFVRHMGWHAGHRARSRHRQRRARTRRCRWHEGRGGCSFAFVGRDVGGFVLLRKTELTVQIWTHLYDIYILITICHEFWTDSLNWVRPDLVRGCTGSRTCVSASSQSKRSGMISR